MYITANKFTLLWLCIKVYLTSPGPSNFGNNFIIFTQFQNNEYHWIPRILPRLVMPTFSMKCNVAVKNGTTEL